MGFELWYSQNTKIRRNGTSYKELKQVFLDNICTKQIFEELQKCLVSEHAEGARDYMTFRDFDVLGVVNSDGEIIGYIQKEELGKGLVGEYLRTITNDLLISNNTSFSTLLPVLTNNSFAFVLNENEINGIITKADINKPLVRLYLFGIISLFEMHINFWISKYLKEEIKEVLSEKRYEAALEIYNLRQKSNDQLTMLDCIQLGDKRDILSNFPEFLKQFDFSRKEFERLMRTTETIRNEMAHSQNTIINSLDWPRFVNTILKLENLLEKSEEELVK